MSSKGLTIIRDVVNFLFSAMGFIIQSTRSFLFTMRDFGTQQFVSGLIWCVFCAWWNSLSQIYVDKMHWAHFKEGENKPLPDIGFILIPRIYISHLPDVWNAIIVIGTLLPVIIFHPARVKIMRRFAAVQGTCFLLRSVTIMATILPNPYDTCVNSSSEDEVPFIEAFKVMLGMRHTCGDVLYSGHAANFTLMALIWQEYGRGYTSDSSRRSVLPTRRSGDDDILLTQITIPRYSKEWYTSLFFPKLFWVIAVIGYFIIIACRFHYTVDVVVGIVVVAKQWGLYHMVIRTPKLLEKVPFLEWYESKGPYAKPDDLDSAEAWDDAASSASEFGFIETPRPSPKGQKKKPPKPVQLRPVVMGSPVYEVPEAEGLIPPTREDHF